MYPVILPCVVEKSVLKLIFRLVEFNVQRLDVVGGVQRKKLFLNET